MSSINFNICGASIDYYLDDNGRREELRINDEVVVESWGDVGAWGPDYHLAVAGLHGASKDSATRKYLRERAERLIISELLSLREMIKENNHVE